MKRLIKNLFANRFHINLLIVLTALLFFAGCAEDKDSEDDLPDQETFLPANFSDYVNVNLGSTSFSTNGAGTVVLDISSFPNMAESKIENLSNISYTLKPNGKIDSATYSSSKLTLNLADLQYSSGVDSTEDKYYVQFTDSQSQTFTIDLFKVIFSDVTITGNQLNHLIYDSGVPLNLGTATKKFAFIIRKVTGFIDDSNAADKINDTYGADGVSPDTKGFYGRCITESGLEDPNCEGTGDFKVSDINGNVDLWDGQYKFASDGFPGNALLAFFKDNTDLKFNTRMSDYNNILDHDNQKVTMNESLSAIHMKPGIRQVFYVGNGSPSNPGIINDSQYVDDNSSKTNKYVFQIPENAVNIIFGIQDNEYGNNVGSYMVNVGLIISIDD